MSLVDVPYLSRTPVIWKVSALLASKHLHNAANWKITSSGDDDSHHRIQDHAVDSLGEEVGHMVVYHGHSRMGLEEGSHDGKDHRNHHGAVVDSHQLGHELAVEIGSGHGHHHSNPDGEVESYHGSHGGYIHEVRGDRSHHSLCDLQANEIWGGSHEGYPAGSIYCQNKTCGCEGPQLTSATHVTRTPLNSRPSSFSTAVFRSAAVSNSTKLLSR